MNAKDSKSEQPCDIRGITTSTFETMFSEIELAIKRGTVELCPCCGRIATIHSNPMYYHECEYCKWQGDYRNCKTKTAKEFVREIIDKYWNLQTILVKKSIDDAKQLRQLFNQWRFEEWINIKKKGSSIKSSCEKINKEKSRFDKGQLVYFTPQGIKDGMLMVASIPKKYFELDVAYVIKDIGLYGDGWHILVDGSEQFVHEKYFLDAKPDVKEPTERRKYETITIDGVEYYLIPKQS